MSPIRNIWRNLQTSFHQICKNQMYKAYELPNSPKVPWKPAFKTEKVFGVITTICIKYISLRQKNFSVVLAKINVQLNKNMIIAQFVYSVYERKLFTKSLKTIYGYTSSNFTFLAFIFSRSTIIYFEFKQSKIPCSVFSNSWCIVYLEYF